MPRAVKKKKSQWKVDVQVLQLTPKLHRRIKAAQTVPEAKCNRWAVFGHFLLLQREWKPLLSVVAEQNSQTCKSKTKPLVCCAQRKWEFSLLWWGNPPKLTAHAETCTAKIEGKRKPQEPQLFHGLGRSLLANKCLVCTSDIPLHIWHSFSFDSDRIDLSRSSRLSIRPIKPSRGWNCQTHTAEEEQRTLLSNYFFSCNDENTSGLKYIKYINSAKTASL